MINDTLLPVIRDEIFVSFMNDYINNAQLPFETLERIKNENPRAYIHIKKTTNEYKDYKQLALVCGASVYHLLEQTGEVPFIEKETLKLFSAEISEPGYSQKLSKVLKNENQKILTLIDILNYKSSVNEPMLCMGLNVYGLLRTQAKKNLFAKFETDQQSKLEHRIIN